MIGAKFPLTVFTLQWEDIQWSETLLAFVWINFYKGAHFLIKLYFNNIGEIIETIIDDLLVLLRVLFFLLLLFILLFRLLLNIPSVLIFVTLIHLLQSFKQIHLLHIGLDLCYLMLLLFVCNIFNNFLLFFDLTYVYIFQVFCSNTDML